MLVLSRQRDESIMIGDHIVVTIVDIRGDKVRLGSTLTEARARKCTKRFNARTASGWNRKTRNRSATLPGPGPGKGRTHSARVERNDSVRRIWFG
jgi:hypothetical protein